MKKILITGANSYVGKAFRNWASQYSDLQKVEMISLRGEHWKEKSFKGYDVVLHTVGIAHVDSNPDPKMKSLYYMVNRDLAVETATKAKKEGVRQFIFMSSIIVYGESGHICQPKIIDKDTLPTPANFYGNSKLQAEEGIKAIENDNFKVSIIRPPMIYGKGSKGNYPKLSKLARKVPFFPDIENQRSMLHIDNLCEFIRLLIKYEDNGIFYPQNAEFVKTSEMVKLVAEAHGKKIKLTKVFNHVIGSMVHKSGIVNKVFGNLVYDQKLSEYKESYRVRGFRESILLTEGEDSL